ncbi:Undecaprenyl phosphate-alpha-4-amino-4-deoxy-L-arabinose arabinosyl transferase [Rubripirellula amarantea]|uniref:Undecaprenyl phosphate-alpha-4-amino-4-deoxy-L-arabinose arabinosyl transferase n=2 Tax=Rubripirellula amarantea TaxID=2527999 RepID=A0A5C5WTR6_9BACT|nr:Undecaprenyl phosphate-alpha-4-amino-4-deoxy-L-arabinose arabinosyl transferase [Rubripirellula amarantea]
MRLLPLIISSRVVTLHEAMKEMESQRMNDHAIEPQAPPRVRVWLEATFWISLILTLWIHGTRINQHGLRGEEARRGLVAAEMIRTGDWIVPRQQGTIFLSRPPLQNWIIAGTSFITGDINRLAIRLPSVIALLMTVGLIYAYCRRWMGTGPAMLACLAYATMGQVLELGYLGETESMYTLVVAGSILIWHWGWTANWSPKVVWAAGYSLAAAGMLAKGYQAPVYFVASVFLYVVAMGQWRSLFTWAHFVGILSFLAIWNAWNVPYLWMTGLQNTIAMYHNDVAIRFNDQTWMTWAEHLIQFPLEVFVCMLPWSLLLPILLMPRFWKGAGRFREPLSLAIAAIVITFPSVWFTPGAHGRYYMPLYPLLAILIAIATEKVLQDSVLQIDLRHERWSSRFSNWLYTAAWQRYQVGFAVAMIVGAGLIGFGSKLTGIDAIVPETLHRLLLVAMLSAVAVTLLRTMKTAQASQFRVAVIATVIGVGVIHVGIITRRTLVDTNDTRAVIAEIKQSIPADQPLVSVGLVDHLFALHYRDEIPIVADIKPADDLDCEVTYVCFNPNRKIEIPHGVRLETIKTINCKRSKKSSRDRQVTIAKCVWDAEYIAELRSQRNGARGRSY